MPGPFTLLALAALSQAPASPPPDPAAEARFLSNVRQLIFEGARSGEGYFSSDGKKLIFQSEREATNPFYQIYVMDLETGDSHRISPGTGKTTCAWIHPNGKKVLFASTHEDRAAIEKQKAEIETRASGKQRRYSWDYDENYDIYETGIKGGAARNLTHALGYDAEGSYSPDGKWIAFASNRHAYTEKLSDKEAELLKTDQSYFVDIYLMSADGKKVKRLTTSKGYDGGPFFSPDGKRIVWRRFNEEGSKAEVHTMKIDGSDVKQVTKLEAMSWAPYHHPSGDYMVFATNLHGFGNFEIYLVDAKGERQPVRVTHTEGFDGLPVFSPDGKRLAFTSSRTANKKAQIFIADWNDQAAREALKTSPAAIPATPRAAPAQPAVATPDVTAPEIDAHIRALSSEKMEGRLTGSEGERLATGYVADAFKAAGLSPAGDGDTYFQAFTFTAGISLGKKNELVVSTAAKPPKKASFVVDKDWRPLPFSKTGELSAEVVFAGYGIVAPPADGFGAYDSYAGLDVKDKWVLVLRYLPENVTPEQRQHLARFAPLRHKAMMARDKGARGIIVASGPASKVKDQLVPLVVDVVIGGTSLTAISVTDAVAETLLSSSGKTLAAWQASLDVGKFVAGAALKGVTVRANVDLEQQLRKGRNALGMLRAGATPAKELVIVGAHVDHLGRGAGGNSLARDDEKGQIHYGADDNASGVAGLLEIAQQLAAAKAKGDLVLKRDVLFAAWSGEELGVLGSAHFAKTFKGAATEPKSLRPDVAAYLNMDMIGRLDKALVLQGVGSSSVWPGEIERRNAPVGLPIVTSNDSYLPTDATSFYLKGVPILSAFTGAHSEYHTPRDTPDRINLQGAEKIVRLMALLARNMATRETAPDYVEMAKPASEQRRGSVRVYLGTIPDYAQGDIKGVKVSGASKGGPAEKAGVVAGDVIVEVAGKKIENIYDYTFALEALKVGEPVTMVVERDGKRVTLKLVPGARE